MFCLSPAIHSGCLSSTLLLQIYDIPSIKPSDISVASGIFLRSQVQERTGLSGLCIVAQQLLPRICLVWFDDSLVCASWAHAHMYSWAFGTLKQNVNTQILEEFPEGVQVCMDTGPSAPVLIHHQRRDEEQGTLYLLMSPSLHHWLWNQGGRTQGLQRDTTSTMNTTHPTERVKQGAQNWNNRSCS